MTDPGQVHEYCTVHDQPLDWCSNPGNCRQAMTAFTEALAKWKRQMAYWDNARACNDCGPMAYTSATRDATTELLRAVRDATGP